MNDIDNKYRILFDKVEEGVALVESKSGRPIKINQRFCEIIGYTMEEMLNSTFQAITHPDDRSTSMNNIALLLAGEIPDLSMVKRYIRKDGGIVWVKRTVLPIWAEELKIDHHICVVQDITESKQMEEALRESEGHFRSFADYAYNWEIWRGIEQQYKYISPSCERITGYSVEEFMNDRELEMKIVHPDDRSLYNEHKDFTTTKVFNFDYRIITKNGEERWINHLCRPIFDPNGNFLGRRISNRNITTRKLLEKELEANNQRLETLVKERTADLQTANDHLHQEIMKYRKAQQLLRSSIKESKEKTYELSEMNSALKILLNKREEDRKDLEEKIMISVKRLVMPYVEELTNHHLDTKGRICTDAIRSGLEEIISPFLQKISVNYMNLTPREIQVANLVKGGKRTKEIALFMNISPNAVNIHRNNIRRKLKIIKKKINLHSFLSSQA